MCMIVKQGKQKMLKVYNFETQKEQDVSSEQIVGIGLTDESLAHIIETAVHGPYIKVSRYKLAQMHWYLSQVSIMLMKLMLQFKISELILPISERQTLGDTYALGAREEQETGKVCFTLANRLTGKEVEYGTENSH